MDFGLVGEKLNYSLSVDIHHKLYKLLNLDHTYKNFEVTGNDFGKFFQNNLSGFNVTIPYKRRVIDYLDVVDNEAQILQSVNTVLKRNAKLYGYNTDIIGFEMMLEYFKVNTQGVKVIILGTGASARMVKYVFEKLKCTVFLVGINDGDYCYSDSFDGDILVNTTPVGMLYHSDESLLTLKQVSKFSTIIDINYNPYRTKLLRYGIYNNKTVISGLFMLVAQAIKSEELFLKKSISDEYIKQIYYELINKNNIALIGMMGSGKTTVGKIIAKKLNKEFFDLDEYIQLKENKTIEELFEIGESYFRNLESKYLKQLSLKTNIVIACGGGVVLNSQNIDNLYLKSRVICIERSIDEIYQTLDTKNRPLVKDDTYNKLEIMYSQRTMLYNRYSEKKFKNRDIDNTIKQIIEYVG